MKWIIWGVALAVLVPVALVFLGIALNRPPLLAPPGPKARLATYLGQNVAELKEDSAFPELEAPAFSVAPERLLQAVMAAGTQLGWSGLTIDGAARSVTAVVETPLWGFKDDIVVRVEPSGEERSVLLARSASRIGKGDMAANARHLRDLVEVVEADLGRAPG